MHLSSNTGVDVGVIGREFDYRIESGSARKPNKDTRVAQMQQAVQTLAPLLSNLATGAGLVDPYNALISDWADSLDLDASKYLLPPPPPPPPLAPPSGDAGAGAGGPSNGPAEAPIPNAQGSQPPV
jgi:hypothetical protein